ncbi:flagellar hook-length control protein FliK [Leisingera daeponensis]|uniref:flagellar hook-length control protein FliK n=1 Tax=Leisingera daeponensis TaxID=405746 RepID=UPI001C94997F|nr:flagellar hook-length control protein FliK [Leisingera daeponensis]MBY6056950.1 flagellar hook-length control protein FliK [Leisingera daeponensis]
MGVEIECLEQIMMMNSILGVEPAAGGKATSAATGKAIESSGSRDFSDFLTSDPDRGGSSGNVASTDSESAAEAAKADAKLSETGSETEVFSGEDIETAGAEEGGIEPGTLEKFPVEAFAEDAGEPALESEIAAVPGNELPREPEVPNGKGSAGETTAESDGVEAVQRSKTADVPDGKSSPQPAVNISSAEQAASQPRGNPAAGTTGNAGAVAPVSEASPQIMAAGAAKDQTAERSGGENQSMQAVPLRKEEKHAVPIRAAASLENADIRSQADAGRPDGRSPVKLGATEQPVPGFRSNVPGGQAPEELAAARAVSGFPNEKTVEQDAAKRPEGAVRSVQPGAQAAVQALSASQQTPRAATRNAEVGTDSVKASAERPPEPFAAGKTVSVTYNAGGIQPPPAPQAIQQTAAVFQPLLAGGMMGESSDADPLSPALGLSGETLGLSQILAEASFGSPAAHRPEVPRMIAAQIAEAFAAKGEQKVEVSLNPQELGQVKMRVVTSETGITMIIQTERPETGDLMRRHINELAEEFRRMGYEDISFEFSGGGTGSNGADDGAEDGTGQAGGRAEAQPGSAPANGEQATQNLRLGTAGVDMRV